jgi:hypothetical protein|tara:strand:- start:4 stop:315 length:312 start_codon:yes stop_codon:yes gene_type:complete
MSEGCLLPMARRTPERISEVEEIIKAVQDYGITTVMAVGMGYFIFFIWKYVTEEILPALEKATITTIALIDRIRMLDNDMIRMDQKINTIIELREIKQEKENG